MESLLLSKMVFVYSPGTLTGSLSLMGKGMLGIFAVILIIWLAIALLQRTFRAEK